VVQVLFISWTTPAERVWSRARWPLAGGGMALLVMTVLFVAAEVTRPNPDYVLVDAERPIFVVYSVAFLAFFTISLVQGIRICLPVARVVGKPWLRRGLRFGVAGAIAGMGYTAGRVADIVGTQLGVDLHLWDRIANRCFAVGCLLLLTALMIPLWGPGLAVVADWLPSWRSYRRLLPLWRLVQLAMPEVVLAPTRVAWFDRISPWRLRFRLYRRVIEIQDARLAVRGHLSADLVAAASRQADGLGLAGADRQAFVEAVTLRSALLACRAGLPATTGHARIDRADGSDASAELDWLLKLADVFQRYVGAVPAQLPEASRPNSAATGPPRMDRRRP
jgi:hypothetical protein